jgi:hypothetical protein
MKYKATYVKAKHGRKRIHVLTPYSMNVISLCRFAEKVELAERNDGEMCKTCEKIMSFLVVAGVMEW